MLGLQAIKVRQGQPLPRGYGHATWSIDMNGRGDCLGREYTYFQICYRRPFHLLFRAWWVLLAVPRMMAGLWRAYGDQPAGSIGMACQSRRREGQPSRN